MINKRLSDLPNIGKELEMKLIQVGIETPEQLRSIGSKDAYIKISTISEGPCINMLYALEGAIQEIRWHNLDRQTKDELREFLIFFK